MIAITNEMRMIGYEKFKEYENKMDAIIKEGILEGRRRKCITFGGDRSFSEYQDKLFELYRKNGYKIYRGDGTYHNQLSWFIEW